MLNSILWKQIRVKFGTQYAFAAAVRVSSSTVSRVVNGSIELADDDKARWADALGTTVEELFGETERAMA